ncbi:hypothetical protein B566_EDAN001284 [Ephemera danica]|nr:hypothetical protein B566_EDAN001284 [Ephemera danica]
MPLPASMWGQGRKTRSFYEQGLPSTGCNTLLFVVQEKRDKTDTRWLRLTAVANFTYTYTQHTADEQTIFVEENTEPDNILLQIIIMTLYHFGNCLALVYVPYHLTYKYSGLSEYGAFWKCVQAGGIYVFTQLCKMLVLATFFPTTEIETKDGSIDFMGEMLKVSVDLADIAGLYFVLMGIPGKGHAKVLTAGVGWAGAELILSRFLMLWVGARGAEFDWKYIQKCLESNISLVQHITTATLVWLWSRHDLHRSLVPVVTALLLLGTYKPLLLDAMLLSLGYGPWASLAVRAVATLCLGLTTLHIYAGLAKAIGIY